MFDVYRHYVAKRAMVAWPKSEKNTLRLCSLFLSQASQKKRVWIANPIPENNPR